MDISELLARASAKLNVNSGRGLARELGLPFSLLARYQHRESIPSDETMLRICAVANVEPERGLILVNMWRSKGRARAIYARMLKGLPAIAASNRRRAGKSKTHAEQINANTA